MALAYKGMSESDILSDSKDYHKYNKCKDSNNKDYGQDSKYPLQNAEALGMCLEYRYIILDIEYLLYSFPKSFKNTCETFKNFRNKNKEPFQKVTHVFLVFLSIRFGQPYYSALFSFSASVSAVCCCACSELFSLPDCTVSVSCCFSPALSC